MLSRRSVMPVTRAHPTADVADFTTCIETFVRGFAFTRSFTHPYLPEHVGGVWVVRDAPRKRAADYRREEWIAWGDEPAEVDRLARRHARGHYCVCAFRATAEPDATLRTAYKALGYRLGGTEPFMTHRLSRVPKVPEPCPVVRVSCVDHANRLAKAARTRQVLPHHLDDDSPLWQYVALDGDRPVGWVRSVVVPTATGPAAWVSNMFVLPAWRRRGIGRSMLARMLRDDRRRGATRSVLLASHTGAMLYPRVGYESLGELLIYTPVRGRK
jgi:GNAT superfamily N-acetyltransferase